MGALVCIFDLHPSLVFAYSVVVSEVLDRPLLLAEVAHVSRF